MLARIWNSNRTWRAITALFFLYVLACSYPPGGGWRAIAGTFFMFTSIFLLGYNVRDTKKPPRNQCDGCARGLPIIRGLHHGPTRGDLQACTADRYAP